MNRSMQVEFYETAAGKNIIAEFLDSLPDKDVAKIFREIDLLSEYGTELREPHAKHIEGPIWELRVKFSSNIYRIFYFVFQGDRIVLLHAFAKKTQKTPQAQVKIAERNLRDYILRYG